jgi:hypothetical protein
LCVVPPLPQPSRFARRGGTRGRGQLHELARPFDQAAVLFGSGDGHAAAASEIEQAFVAQRSKCAQDRIAVAAEYGS